MHVHECVAGYPGGVHVAMCIKSFSRCHAHNILHGEEYSTVRYYMWSW